MAARSETFHFADEKGRPIIDAKVEGYRADTKALLDTDYTDKNGDVTLDALLVGVDALIYCYHHGKTEFIYNYAPPGLDECPGDLDDIDDGTTYGKIKVDHISAGYITLVNAVGDLDDIANGTYGKVLTTDISAGHIILGNCIGTLNAIVDGQTYGKVLLTNLSSGNIKLTSNVVIDGEWYDESGVEIDADTGINIYGTDSALTTRATKTGTIQCKVDSSGNISAGAGNVLLNSDGITIQGQKFTMKDSNGTHDGVIYIDDTTHYLVVDAWDIEVGNIRAATDSTKSIGGVGKEFAAIFVDDIRMYQNMYVDGGGTIADSTNPLGNITSEMVSIKERASSPSNIADVLQLFSKSDNKVYAIDGDGVEDVLAKASQLHTRQHAIDSGDDHTGISSTTFDLDGEFDANMTVTAVKIGNVVTLTANQALTHDNDFIITSANGVVPSAYRPSDSLTNVYYMTTSFIALVQIQSGGIIAVWRIDWAGSPISDTDSPIFTISYVIT